MNKIVKIGFVAIAILFAAPKLYAQISIGINISANIAPPALPVYTQPACPVDGYLWVPGYWAWDQDAEDYYWIPGVWVAAPQPGYLWTPAYWGYNNGVYGFHAGYWGRHVGFYGGINYGYGYGGVGFIGGGWSAGHFRYNTAVVNVNTTVVHNTYVDKTVIVNNTVINNNHTSFNGQGGIQAKPRPEELAATNEQHIQATSQQQSHEQTARQDKTQFSKSNGGTPTTVAMNKVGGAHFNAQGARAPRQSQQNGPINKDNGNQQVNSSSTNHAKPNVGQTPPDQNNTANNGNPADNKADSRAKNKAVDLQKPDNQANNKPAAPQMPANAPAVNQPNRQQRPNNAPRRDQLHRQKPPAPQHKAPKPQHEQHSQKKER